MFVPKIDDGVSMRQTASAEIGRVISERLGRARVGPSLGSGVVSRPVKRRPPQSRY